ncbi:MAG TPA: pilus assembly protein PilP [Polyangiaceae bacterium]|jgi:type IV pilus assembly protein PilP|nr:pilus assembly protein PilP [Polyangiaceae bacterium]
MSGVARNSGVSPLPLLLALASFGCSDPPVVSSPGTASATEAAPAAPAPGPAVAPSAAAAANPPPKVEVQENEFSESERSRDPFRSFAKNFAQDTKAHVHSQRQVILSQYALDELRLIGIVTRAEPAKAMLVDPTGKGFVIQRGQFVGRPDVVQGAGATGTVYEINWRVDRIRPSDVVLIREDPANPDVPSATRVIPLRPEEDVNASGEKK